MIAMLFRRPRMHIPKEVDPRSRRVVLRIGLALGILGAIAFGRELVLGIWERIDDYYVGQAARAASQAVDDRLSLFAARLDTESTDSSVRYVLIGGDKDLIAIEEVRIARTLPLGEGRIQRPCHVL